MKKIVCFFILVSMIQLARADAPFAEEIHITDMAGRAVVVPSDPDRIICLGPGTLRLIVYLQAKDKVVGVEDMEKRTPDGRPYRMANPELGRLPRIGPGGPASINKKPDLEAVLNVSPQVIFVTYMEPANADEIQKILGIPVVVLTYGEFATFDEAVYDSLRLAGKILSREKRADAVVEYIEALRSDLGQRTGSIPESRKPGVYVGGIGYRGAHGIESTEKNYIPLKWAGARNLSEGAAARSGSHLFMDKEMLLRLDPDVIFIDGGGLALVKADYRKKPEYYNGLKAVKAHQVYALLPFNWYVTNIGTAMADAFAIGKILYPDRFTDTDPGKKADEIYTFLVGRPVYSGIQAIFGKIGAPVSFSGR
ncbi:iron ABC transporter substrate-binding protein [Desulfonema ishimotonii]|uniref:Iron ABC transporter substrate-binding protein n=1 Tax=Desulfonema ishimotonii TaxID=45657 RepID=A0A401G2Y6_9BACT|nr:iron ABC transporter substrate-binding protein [Desulfonema ishimotonii]GBC63612.1 iron ABC transporter substrate-binding protein [Desulfonema ishimotonii]